MTMSCLKFIRECFEFNVQLNESLKLKKKLLLHPFSFPLCTISGYIF
jgi:hypothetical protein